MRLVFDAQFAGQPAESFVLDHLVARLSISAVVTGADFRWPVPRGDVPLLQAMGRMCGFATHVVGECRIGGRRAFGSPPARSASSSGAVGWMRRNACSAPFRDDDRSRRFGWQFDAMQILLPDRNSYG